MTVQRWTDVMLDELASTVQDLVQVATQNQRDMEFANQEIESSKQNQTESISEIKDSIDGLRVTAQALLQVAAQSQRDMEFVKEEIELAKKEIELGKQRQAESDERFNVLLEEIRYLIRRNEGE